MKPAAKVLPVAARALLQRAAQTPVTRDDPLARQKAIEHAIARVKREHPYFFKEPHHEAETE